MVHVETLQVLADPARFRIVEMLRAGEKPVGEIAGGAGIDQSGVSRHLRILHAAGIVRRRAQGQQRLYSLRPERFQELEAWLASYRSMWERRLDRLEAALRQRKGRME